MVTKPNKGGELLTSIATPKGHDKISSTKGGLPLTIIIGAAVAFIALVLIVIVLVIVITRR